MTSNFKLTFFGLPIIYFDKINSTNSYLKENSSELPSLVITDYQTNGRGQYGKEWASNPEDNLLFSFQFKPKNLELNQLHFISEQIAVSLIKVINDFNNIPIDQKAKIKWPNDILINNKKIGGILIETNLQENKIQKIIVGIGINIDQKTFSKDLPNASSLAIEIPSKKWNKQTLLQLIIKEFEEMILLFNSPITKNIEFLTQCFNHNFHNYNEEISVIYNKTLIKVINLGVNEKGHWILKRIDNNELIEIRSSRDVEYVY